MMSDVLQTASRNRVPIVLGLCATGVIIGSLGPWARIVVETVNGVSGDGQVTLFLGVLAGAFILLEVVRYNGTRSRYLTIMFAFMLAGVIGMNVWLDFSSTVSESELNASVEWGLKLMTVAACAGCVMSFIQVKAINRAKRLQNEWRRAAEEQDAVHHT